MSGTLVKVIVTMEVNKFNPDTDEDVPAPRPGTTEYEEVQRAAKEAVMNAVNFAYNNGFHHRTLEDECVMEMVEIMVAGN